MVISNLIKQQQGLGILCGILISSSALAAGQVSSIRTSTIAATPFVYSVNGVEYQWGMGNNQIMEGFGKDGQAYNYALSADRVEIIRDDIDGITTGEPCGIFVEQLSLGNASRQFAADYPSDGSGTGNCDIPALLASRVLNRGAVDLFSNKLPDAKNIERLDYLFDYGVLAPFSKQAMSLAGHVASEKSSNNELKIAAILKLDVLGQPTAYGPLVQIDTIGCIDPAICYGSTNVQHAYSFLQNDFHRPQSYPEETETSHETVGMAFVSTAALGLTPGQRYYGFSFFASDVIESQHDLLNPASFPDNTANEHGVTGDDADVYGGLSGYFLADSLSVTDGSVFLDINGNGLPDDNEAGISDITVSLYEDNNGDGILDLGVDQPLGDSINSDVNGNFVLPGIPDGNYLVVLDESDLDLPPGLDLVPGSNPQAVTIAGSDSDPVYFVFTDPDNGGSTGGLIDDGADGGGSDSGSVDGAADGATDSGTDDGAADGATDSGTDDGAVDGATDSGTDDGAADGATDSGTDDGAADGATDSGTDDGAADGATDSGTDDGAADGATDSGTDDGAADGATDSGTDGGPADGGSDSGSDDGGDDGSTGGGSPINDDATNAVNDSFEVNQGQAAVLDVLANDFDGAGSGLTLLSVSSSGNASIAISNNQIDYRPDFGFYGSDSFLYVMEDIDGFQSTGNVSVEVVRYSDLNNNQENDYVECGCDSLVLETGVNGVGLGSTSLLAALALFLNVCLRRRMPRIERSAASAGDK